MSICIIGMQVQYPLILVIVVLPHHQPPLRAYHPLYYGPYYLPEIPLFVLSV